MDTLDLLKKIEEKNKKLCDFFGDSNFLDEIIDGLYDVVLTISDIVLFGYLIPTMIYFSINIIFVSLFYI
jgi:hypothetical protein